MVWHIVDLEKNPDLQSSLPTVYSCATGWHDSGKFSFMSFWHGQPHVGRLPLLGYSVGWQFWPLGPCQISLRESWRRAVCLVLVTLRLVLPDVWITLKFRVLASGILSKRVCMSLSVFWDTTSLRVLSTMYVMEFSTFNYKCLGNSSLTLSWWDAEHRT